MRPGVKVSGTTLANPKTGTAAHAGISLYQRGSTEKVPAHLDSLRRTGRPILDRDQAPTALWARTKGLPSAGTWLTRSGQPNTACMVSSVMTASTEPEAASRPDFSSSI